VTGSTGQREDVKSSPTLDLEELCRAEARRVSALRLQLLDLHPFWGFLLAHLKVVQAPALCAFAATDCHRHIWLNPLLTHHLDLPQLGFVLAHELGHHLLASADRQRGRQAQRWNCASDFAINRIVAAIDHPARPGERLYRSPSGHYPELGTVEILLDPRWDGMIAEAIYEYLDDEDLPLAATVTVRLEEPGDSAGGQGTDTRATDHGGGLDVHLPGRLTPEERQEVRDRVQAAVDHAQRSDQPGHIPGQVLRELGSAGRAQVPWRRLLQRYAGAALARDDYALHRPDRRFVEHDLLVPGRWSEGLASLVVALDTSASISPALLEAVGAELRTLAQQAQELRLIVADAQVQQVVDDLELERFLARRRVKGGGGTDHRPVFAWMKQQGLRPDVFVGITDLYSRFPERAPGYPVLWLAPPKHGSAPWGRVVELDS
jgi:predicted metal-dependent peptidase